MEGGRNAAKEVHYKCGECLFICTTIVDLHVHVIDHVEGGNYFFDNALKTAFPKHNTIHTESQTIEHIPILINNIKQEFIEQADSTETVSKGTQTINSVSIGTQTGNSQFIIANIRNHNTVITNNDKRAKSLIRLSFDNLQKDNKQIGEFTTIDTLAIAHEPDNNDRNNSDKETGYDEKIVKVEEVAGYTKLISVRKRKTSGSSMNSGGKKNKKTAKETAFKKSETLTNCGNNSDDDKEEDTVGETVQLKEESGDSEDDKMLDDNSVPERKTYSCTICNIRISIGSRQAWEIHVEHRHYHEYPFQCEMCYVPCHDQDELAVHNCSLALSESHECMQCPDKKQFKYRCNLEDHIKDEHDRKYPMKCETCHLPLISELEKRKHMAKHDPSLLICGYCSKQMKTVGELDSHLPNHTGETKFHCHICDKKYRKKAYLRDHIFRIHASEDAKQCICEKCGSSFAHSKVLYDHRRSSCGEPIYECDLCDKKFCQKTSLKYHIRNHTGDRPFICDFCGDRFIYRNTLSSHIKHRHTNDRQFKCSMCEKSFVKLCTLQRHERVHLKIKMYTCEYCKKEFSTNWNLKAHMRQHTGATPYTCTMCGLGFAHNVVRKTHEAKCKGVTFS